MQNIRKFKCLSLLALLVFLQNCSQTKNSEPGYYTIEDYEAVEKIDTHVHILTDDTTFIQQSAEDNFRLLTINVDAPSVRPFEEQRQIAIRHIHAFPDKIAFAATFSVKNWNDEDWEEQTIAYLKESFSKGAIAVKIWKNVGMDLKDKNGNLVMIDNPRFDPILDYLAKNNIPLIGHFGEPKNCWLPIEEMTVNDYKDYYRNNPQYHMYLHPGFTSYEDQVNARDRMLEKRPDLLFIGAHLGSLEWSVDELAKRLDKFPNMAVDMAERISHFQHQAISDWQKVHDFFIQYQDRLLYATDIIVDGTKSPSEMKQHAHDVRLSHWRFFTTDEKMYVPSSVDGEFKGLKLPREVIDKIYFKNAEKWLPGISNSNLITDKSYED